MTGDEFADLISRTGWSARAVAKRFNISHGTVHDMKLGRTSPDPIIVRYLQGVAAAIEAVRMPPLPLPDRRYRD